MEHGTLAAHNLATEVWGFIDASGHAHVCLVEGCYYRGDVIPHKSSGPATEETDEVCLDCGYVITLSKNHVHASLDAYQQDENGHYKICGCGEVLERGAHTDDDLDGKCDVCSITLTKENAGPVTTTTAPKADEIKEEKGSFLWLWILIGVVVIAGGVVGVVLIKKKAGNEFLKKL